MEDIFVTKDKDTKYLKGLILADKNRYAALVEALRSLGNFDEKMILFAMNSDTEEPECNDVGVMDKDGTMFSFAPYGFTHDERYQLKTQNGSYFVIYHFFKSNKPFSKLDINVKSEGYVCENGKILEINKNVNDHPKRYDLRIGNTDFWFSLPGDVRIDELQLKNAIDSCEDIDFYSFFNIVRTFVDIKETYFMRMGVIKNNIAIGEVAFDHGVLSSFNITSEKEGQKLGINLQDGELRETATLTTILPIENLDGKLKLDLSTARQIVKTYSVKKEQGD